MRHLVMAHVSTQDLSSLDYFLTLLLKTVSLLDCIFMSLINCILAHHDGGWGTGKGLFGSGQGPGITSLDVWAMMMTLSLFHSLWLERHLICYDDDLKLGFG